MNSTTSPPLKLAYDGVALEFIEGLPTKLRKRIVEKIEKLQEDPFPPGSIPLRGSRNNGGKVYRIRIGDYRILYILQGKPKEILILDVGDRKDIYR